jgi:hypothetical protein
VDESAPFGEKKGQTADLATEDALKNEAGSSLVDQGVD